MASISNITASDAQPVSEEFTKENSCSPSPILNEGESAKEFGGVLNAQVGLTNSLESVIKMKCLDKAFEMCKERAYYKTKKGIVYCYDNNPSSINKAYKSLLRFAML